MAAATPPVCPKSDSAVRAAVKTGAIVVPLGKSAVPTADAIRSQLGHRARPGTDWEESRVLHLILVVECSPMNGDCCEAASKFMRQLRASDGYATYAAIIGRKVAVVGLGKLGRTGGAAKVEEACLRRGGCTRLAPIGRAEIGALSAPWLNDVCKALDEDAPDGAPECAPAAAEAAQPSPAAAQPSPRASKPPAAAQPSPRGAAAIDAPADDLPAKVSKQSSADPWTAAAVVVVTLAVGVALMLANARARGKR